ncbi:hypothetical protein MBRA1_003473 [Malassezia brasiliensis]|uniref:ARM repeat-containing protein n=1 Tax=Malassezia brasiliensis TaxID=1821822 RepID=A0AAF0IR53_9BASI|nr:hypothetical protein MBRA1_003473 [Malassezia brasiliensis]
MDGARDDESALGATPPPPPWGDVQAAVDEGVQVSADEEVHESATAAMQAAEAEVSGETAAPAAAAPGAGAADAAGASEAVPRCLLDVPALGDAVRNEQVDLFLLEWLTAAEALLSTDRSDSAAFVDEALCLIGARRAEQTQPSVLDTLVPGRGARQLLARCLVHIYLDEQADKPLLYDVLGALQDAFAREPVRPETLLRHVAAVDACAALVRALPSAAAMCFGTLVPVCLRQARQAQAPVLARSAILHLLEALLMQQGVGALPPAALKELYKTLRGLVSDKAGAVVRASCACLGALAEQHDALRARAEVEGVVAQCTRALATADVATRTALAELVAQLVLQTDLQPVGASGAGAAAGAGDAEEDEAAAPKGPVRVPLYAPPELLAAVQTHVALKPGMPWRARYGAVQVYAAVLARAGPVWVEGAYVEVLEHLLDTVAQHTLGALGAEEAAPLRVALSWVVRHYLCATLSEPAQARAAVEVGARVLSAWPARTPQSAPPGEAALSLALELGAALVAQLGGVTREVHEALYEPVMTLLAHPVRAVQVRAAWWLRVACGVHPALLAPTYTRLLEAVRRDVGALRAAQPDDGVGLRARLGGHSSALAALVAVAAAQPLYARHTDAEEVFVLATELLQHVAAHPLREAAAAVAAAWMLLGSLLALGPLFVRAHWARLLQLWRNALAAPPLQGPLDEGAWAFLLGVREHALHALLACFLHGGAAAVLTGEGARRVVGMLGHVRVMLDTLPPAVEEQPVLRVRAARVRALLLRCCVQLAGDAALQPLHAALMQLALHVFARPERFGGSAAQAAISASLGGAQASLWTNGEAGAAGVTSLLVPRRDGVAGATAALEAWRAPFVPAAYGAPTWLRDVRVYGFGAALEALAHTPAHGALEAEPGALYVVRVPPGDAAYDAWLPEMPAPVGGVVAEVDAALELFAALLPFVARDVQVGAVEAVAHAATRAPGLERHAGRRTAVLANSVVALLGALRTAMHASNAARRPAGFANDRVTQAVQRVAQAALVHGDAMLRASAGEVYGRLAAVAGSHAVSAQVPFVVAQIVDNRHADARASCAYAAGQVYARVGGLHAAPLTQTLGRLLVSLARDPHPVVQYAALDALQLVVEAASLAYQPYVASTLGVLGALVALPTHEPEGGSVGSSNLRAALPVYSGVARVAGALAGVLGADLRVAPARRAQLQALLGVLAHDRGAAARGGAPTTAAGAAVRTDAVQGLQRLGLVVPEALATRAWAALLYDMLQSPPAWGEPLLLYPCTAARAYEQMAQRGPEWLATYGGRPLLHALFAALDAAPMLAPLRALLLVWVQASAAQRPCAWVDLCATLLLAPEALAAAGAAAATAAAPTVPPGEEEGAALAAAPAPADGRAARGACGWRTRLFVLACLDAVLHAVRGTAHVGAAADAGDAHNLASRVGELIKMAFAASTATSRAVRCAGLQILREVMEAFAATRDPAFPTSRLLEQYQAPLAAALTPAFGADSFPEVLAAAVAVCAVYVRVGGADHAAPQTNRVVKLLTSALDESRAEPMTRLGGLVALPPHSAAYLRIAVLQAWAELAIAPRSAALDAVLAPHHAELVARWSDALAAYAQLREDPDATLADGAMAALVHAQRLAYYEDAWPAMLHAVTLALDGAAGAAPAVPAFALYALAFETLCRELERGARHTDRGTLAVVLASLPVLAEARYAGEALAEPAQLDELLRVAQRAFLTHDVPVALGVLRVLHALARSMHERLLADADGRVDDRAFARTPLGYVVRLLFAYLDAIPAMHGAPADKAALHTAAWTTLVGIVQVCPPAVQTQLLASTLHVLAAQARREDDAAYVLGATLAALLRPLCAAIVRVADAPLRTAVHGFLSALLDIASAMRSRSGAMAACKSRNALVGVGGMLAALDARVPVSVEVVDAYGFLLAEKLRGDAPDAHVAVQCAAALVPAAAARRSARLALGAVVPALVAYVHTHGTADDTEGAALVPALDVLGALPGLATEARGALGVVLPVLVDVLERVRDGQLAPALHAYVCTYVVRTAQTHAAALKAATAALPDAARHTLQHALRPAGGGAHGPRAPPRGEARIALKTFGS